MKLRNKIINYFVVPPFQGEGVRVIRSKFTINPKEAKVLLTDRFKKDKKTPLPPGDILQICFDVDSGIIYAPNASDFLRGQMDDLLDAVKYRITQDFGNFANRPVINSNPFSSLRVRYLGSFGYANKMVKEFLEIDVHDIPIIEANLSIMPQTVACLPNKYTESPELWGSYISSNFVDEISFCNEDGKSIHRQKTPFILINTSHGRGATEKEWVVIDAFNEHCQVFNAKTAGINRAETPEWSGEDSVIYAVKRLLYMGWTFEEISGDMLSRAENVVDLVKGIAGLMLAIDKETEPYYVTFKMGDNFPISLDEIWNKSTGKIDLDRQYSHLQIIDYDVSNSYVMLRTPAYIPSKTWEKIFNPNGSVFIAKYNHNFNTIDVKSGNKSMKDERQLQKIAGLVGCKLLPEDKDHLCYSSTPRAQGKWASSPLVFNVRKISDYGYATEFIKEMCTENRVPFYDFQVIVGPIEHLFGRGVQGGFMDATIFKKNKMSIPFKLIDDIYIEPPVIFVNTVESPSYPEHTEILIHEYRHYIYGIMNPTYKIGYTMPNGSDMEGWNKYLMDPNERDAHRAEIRFGLKLGRSFDEIIRGKVGGIVTQDNYPIAVKFSELVNEVMNNIEEESNENIT